MRVQFRVASCIKQSFRLVWSGAADPRGCRKATIPYRTGMWTVWTDCMVCRDTAQSKESELLGLLGNWEMFAREI